MTPSTSSAGTVSLSTQLPATSPSGSELTTVALIAGIALLVIAPGGYKLLAVPVLAYGIAGKSIISAFSGVSL